MSQKVVAKFIVIDDDNINNFLVKGVLKQLFSDSEVECFSNPEIALEHLINLPSEAFKDLIIFLDLNMPVINGWDVLDKLSIHFGGTLPGNSKLYISSSSDIENDISRSKSYELVSGYLTKQINQESLKEIL